MTLRPREARWFEVLTDREHLGAVLGCLAATRAVELEAKSAVGGVAALPDYRLVLGEFGELTRRYAPFWPTRPSIPRRRRRSRSPARATPSARCVAGRRTRIP